MAKMKNMALNQSVQMIWHIKQIAHKKANAKQVKKNNKFCEIHTNECLLLGGWLDFFFLCVLFNIVHIYSYWIACSLECDSQSFTCTFCTMYGCCRLSTVDRASHSMMCVYFSCFSW